MKYYYAEQYRKVIKQTMRIFAGLEVRTGVDRDGDGKKDAIKVPIYYGDMDEIIANVLHTDGTWASQKLPIMSMYMSQAELNLEEKQNPYYTDTVIHNGTPYKRMMPVPYKLTLELNIYASSTDQLFQILEQIQMLFIPTLSIQISDEVTDWTYIRYVTLVSQSNEGNYPAGQDVPLKMWSMTFEVDAMLSYPMLSGDDKVKLIKKINGRLLDDAGLVVFEECKINVLMSGL